MMNKSIVFTAPNKVEIEETEYPELQNSNSVLVKTLFTTISPGTERANLMGDPNINAATAPTDYFPRRCGYALSGVVLEAGSDVKDIKAGDYVIGYNGTHTAVQNYPRERVVKFDPDVISPEVASTLFIATFPLAAIRKTRVEMGESALVMGCGLLGQFALRLLRCAGAYPVIAADPVMSRRTEALNSGADYALDPTSPDFADTVKKLTCGGTHVAIEVSGVGAGLDGALDCMRRYGRVALLGCTRDKNFSIDYYRKVHFPGITIVGAHTSVRPQTESYPGYFSYGDDFNTLMGLIAGGRLSVSDMLGAVYSPLDCVSVYDKILYDRSFPTVAQFDWRNME